MTLRALVFGASGQAGTALQLTAPASSEVIAHQLRDTDIRDARAVARAIADARPHVIFNCAAYTAVDAAERDSDEAFQVNAVAAGIVAEAAEQASIRLVHISTDYVFDGSSRVPYAPQSPPAPINAYGATKLEGERRVLAASPRSVIVRTAWLHSSGGTNFVRTAMRILSAGQVMRVVDDQIGTPTHARHLAQALWCIAAHPDVPRILHFTDAGVASWFDVAVAAMEAMRDADRLPANAGVVPIATSEYPTPARRPLFSVLDKHESWKAIGYVPPHWRHGIVASIRELLNA